MYTLTHDDRGWTPCKDGVEISQPFQTELEGQNYIFSLLKMRGRPPLHEKAMRQTAVWLPEEMITWLKAQSGTMSETIRKLIEQAMQ